MRFTFLGLVVALAISNVGCAKSTCEKYADMEVKCTGIPSAEADFTRTMAQAMCADTPSASEAGAKEFSDQIKREASCADKTSDCAVYNKCVADLKATPGTK
jgi:hypothetical protein